jgi:hypothetical protein
MPVKKKQHYIPRFYLKYFSNNKANTHIGLYHIATQKLIREADLKNQAYENYFYGKDGKIEDGLAIIESKSSEIFSKIISSHNLPKPTVEDYTTILVFSLFQGTRTKSNVKETNQMINKTLKSILSHDKRFKDDLENLEFGINDTAAFNLKTTISSLDVAKDLSCKLIINKSKIAFITSDHPVVLYNQFLEKRKFPGGRTGLALKGLQVFYPIDPWLTIMFYDSKVYKCGFKKRNTIETSNIADVNYLNLLQTLNCNELIYFNEIVTDYYIERLKERSERYLRSDRSEIHEYPEKEKSDSTFSTLMHYYKHPYELKLQLSFCKETDHAKNYKLTGFAVELRDEKLRYRER